ncbi:MAG: RNase adapter RapZ [Clostridiales bacterium]|nr:RNase adapter RapZ [Clostridiales bacterium]
MKKNVVVITGMSGAGRSRAADWFEDQGYYCVDNMPPALIKSFLEMASVDTTRIEKIVFVTDIRSRSFFDNLDKVIDELRRDPSIDLTVIFMEASPDEIVKRYNEVRRNHPLSGAEASRSVIEEEAEKLKNVRGKSDIILDTTNLKVSELNKELDQVIFGGSGSSSFAINISSFGFKYGIPSEADVMFDVRFIPNPYYVPSLKKLSGNSKRVSEYIFRNEIATQFVDEVHILLRTMVPGYINEGKYHLNIAFGCTGGHHRSVAVANAVAAKFEADGMRVRVRHRDMNLQNRKK